MHNRLTSSGIDISPARPPEVAEVVDEGFVEEVRDGETGEIHRSADFLKRELRDVNRLRGEQEDLLQGMYVSFGGDEMATSLTPCNLAG